MLAHSDTIEALDAPDDRAQALHRLGGLAYAAMALGVVFYIVTLWAEIYIDTKRLPVREDWFTESHRHWRLRTAIVFLIWSVVGGLTLPFGIGWFAVIPAWCWYVGRIVWGGVAYGRGRVVGAAFVRARELGRTAR